MEQVLGNLKKGIVFVLSAPSGTGKTTLVRMLREEFPVISESISCTTRPIRHGEAEGHDYHFLSEQEFDQRLQTGDFLEHATVFGSRYGTSRSIVEQEIEKGKHLFLVIDTQGAMELRKKKFPAIFIFLSPPSLEDLRERMMKRQTETKESLEHRLSWAEKEMALASKYDYHIVNKNLSVAYDILRSIVIAEEHRVKNA